MGSPPRVTVAIPTWNRAELLRRCIDSVLSQTMPDFELLVFDNASTDHTSEVVASFDDPRITYVRNEENIGNLANCTRALRSGSAPYVVLLFDDDYFLPTCLEKKADFLDEHPDVVLVHSSFEMLSSDGELLDPRANFGALSEDVIETGPEFIEKSMLKPCRIHISSAMMRRQAARHEGLFPEDVPADDHGLWLRMASRGSIGFIHEPLDGLHMVPGMAVAGGFLRLDEGRFKHTMNTAHGAKAVIRRFLETYDASPGQVRRLRRLARRGTRRIAINVLRSAVPGFRPVRQGLRLLIEGLRMEPTLIVDPRLAFVFFPQLQRLRSSR